MTHTPKLLAATLLGLSVGTSAWAIEPGPYIGANIGYGMTDDDIGPVTFDDESFTWKVLGGFRFAPFFGAEASWVDLGDYSSNGADVELDGFTLEGVGYLPLSTNIDLYAKLGAFFWSSDVTVAGISADDDGTDLVGGLGVRAALTENSGVALEWERYAAEVDVDAFTIGVDFRFQ